jgi:hypothetical protein
MAIPIIFLLREQIQLRAMDQEMRIEDGSAGRYKLAYDNDRDSRYSI